MKIIIGYDGGMRARVAAAMLREQGHIVSAAYVTADSQLPVELESKAAADGIFLTAVYGDASTTEGVISALYGHMKAYTFGALATGHIARVSREEKTTADGEDGEKKTVVTENGTPRIAIAADAAADESAKLGLLSAETVSKLVLPLGTLGAGELASYARVHSIPADAVPGAVPTPVGSVGSFRMPAQRVARPVARLRNASLPYARHCRQSGRCRVAYLYSSACGIRNGRGRDIYNRTELCRGRRDRGRLR